MSTSVHSHDHDEHCSCGHDHHQHNQHCSCGHDHSHQHEQPCSCGHDHSHQHEQPCSCGHDHSHQHHVPASGPHVYILENLGCAHCAAKMEERINALPGINTATITYATKQLRILAEHPEKLLPEIQKICSSIESQVVVVKREPLSQTLHHSKNHNEHSHENDHSGHSHKHDHTCHSHNHENSCSLQKHDHMEHQHAHAHNHSNHHDLIEIGICTFLFLLGLLLHHSNTYPMASLAFFIAGYLILGGKILLESAKNISHGQIFDENFLMSVATLGAFAIQEYPEAIGVMLFYRIGELFEHKAVERSRSQIMDALDLRPEVVNLLLNDDIQIIPANTAKPGDLLLIRPGDRIPLDGVIIEGNSRLDTSPITGEPVPLSVQSGDNILSGCVNTSGQLKMRVEKPLSESMITRILNSVENAAANKPKMDRFITRFAKIYTPIVVSAALATAILPSLVDGNWRYWIYTALTFLVMSCPCALVLSVPLAFFSGIGAGSRRKILFKGGASIEALTKVKAVVMDKTGTITQGNFQLQKIVSTSSYSEQELLRLCAACEQHSTHPIAHSIVTAAKEQDLALEAPASMEEIAGNGITAQLSEGTVLCGNRKLMEKYQINLEKAEYYTYGAEVYLAINGTLSGYFLISDTLKADAKSAVHHLKSMGLHTGMLTGDSENSANAVAKEVGITEVHSKLLPHEKLSVLSEIRQKQGAVLFVGDGINDAPVLSGADVGAAMGSGADAAIEAADAVFLTSNVDAIPQAIAIARSTNRIAVQNIIFALAIKILVMILGLLGFANMWMAVFADTGVAMICIINSIRILYKKSF